MICWRLTCPVQYRASIPADDPGDNDAEDGLPLDAEEGDGAGGGANDEENGDDNLLDEEVDVEEDYEGEDDDEDEEDGGSTSLPLMMMMPLRVEQELIRVLFAFNSAHSSMCSQLRRVYCARLPICHALAAT